MFNDDEVRSTLSKMYKYSPIDGFIDITHGLQNMIKSLTNEPSIGLFYVQQHTHKAVPNLVNLKTTIVAKSREIGLHTEDSEDSITTVRSMKECGFPIVDDMINDITKSLAIMSSKQPKKGLIISKPVLGFQTGRTSSWGPPNDVEKSTNYLSSVLKSAKQKVDTLKWVQEDTEELDVSNRVIIGNQEKDDLDLISNFSVSEDFDGFKADKEARFEEWLGDNEINYDQNRTDE